MRLILLSLSANGIRKYNDRYIVVTIRFRIFCIALNIRRSLERKERISSKRNGAIVAVAIMMMMMMTMIYPMMVMLVGDIDDTRNSALYVNSSIRIPENEAIPLFTCFSTSNNEFWSLLKINEQYYLQCKYEIIFLWKNIILH